MTATEFYNMIDGFVEASKNIKFDYEEARKNEEMPNDATQDLLHVAELTPKALQGMNIVDMLHKLRKVRRKAKQELEAIDLFREWCNKNTNAIKTLVEVRGKMEKVLKRQPHINCYRMRTSMFGYPSESYLSADDEDYDEYMPDFIMETEDI